MRGRTYPGERTYLDRQPVEVWEESRPGGNAMRCRIDHGRAAELERQRPGVEPRLWPWERASDPELVILEGGRRRA